MAPSKRAKRSHREPSSSPPPEELEDSEEDEFEAERFKAGPSSARYEQSDDGESEEDEEDGVGQYMEDEGEVVESDDEEEALGKQLSAIPFGSLLKASKKLSAQQQKAAQRARAQQSESDEDEEQEDTTSAARRGKGPMTGLQRMKKERKAERSSKHAPMEMSSKRAVGRTRQIVETSSKKARDPRFDSLSGSFKPDLFSSSYSFLSANQSAELAELKKTAIAARKNHMLPQEEKDAIEDALTRMTSREVSRKNKEREAEALRKWKKEEEEKRKGGKKEWHLKKSDQKSVLLRAKFDLLQADKKQLRKTVEKKRRKVANKDKKLLPNKRPGV